MDPSTSMELGGEALLIPKLELIFDSKDSVIVMEEKDKLHQTQSGKVQKKRPYKTRTTVLLPGDEPSAAEALLTIPEINQENIGGITGNSVTPEGILQTLRFLAKYRLIANTSMCVKCGDDRMSLNSDNGSDKFLWRCLNCRKGEGGKSSRISVRHNSFFRNSRLKLDGILKLAACWAAGPTNTLQMVAYTNKVSKSTVSEFFCLFRDLTQAWMERVAVYEQLGGEGKVVEVEEGIFAANKFQRGPRDKEELPVFMFGAIERDTEKVAYSTVTQRSATTLLSFIAESVAPGSIVVSDSWSTYGDVTWLQTLFNMNHDVKMVTFFSPSELPTNVEAEELEWRNLKKSIKGSFGSGNVDHPYHMCEYFFRRFHKNEKMCNKLLYEMALTCGF